VNDPNGRLLVAGTEGPIAAPLALGNSVSAPPPWAWICLAATVAMGTASGIRARRRRGTLAAVAPYRTTPAGDAPAGDEPDDGPAWDEVAFWSHWLVVALASTIPVAICFAAGVGR
jgi:hypothetical protein